MKRIRAASAVGALCTSQEALRRSIDALRAHFNMYNLKVWLILCKWDTCASSVKELEEVLAVEESMDEEAEMTKEKAQYNAKRIVMAREKVVEDEDEDEGKGEGESESDEEDDEPVGGPVLSAKVQGKRPAK